MKNLRIIPLTIGAMLFTACTPRLTTMLKDGYGPLAEEETVMVFDESGTVPAEAEHLGEVSVTDVHGLPAERGSYEAVVGLAENAAKKAGGNILQVTDHRAPDETSKIHRIRADVYRYGYTDGDGVVHPLNWVPEPSFWKVSVLGGGAYLLECVSDSSDPSYIQDMAKEFRIRPTLNAEVMYYWRGKIGYGLKYSDFHRRVRAHDIVTAAGPNGEMDIKSYFWYLGPEISYRVPFAWEGTAWYATLGFGYMGMRYGTESSGMNLQNYTSNGGTIGELLETGLDVGITKNLSAGLSLSLTRGHFFRATFDVEGAEQWYWLDTQAVYTFVSASLGLRWYFGM